MRRFKCPACGSRVFFENFYCNACETQFAFSPSQLKMSALGSSDPSAADQARSCANREHEICNWAVEDDEKYCRACRLNEIIPNLSKEKNIELWRKTEVAKRRVILDLICLGLPVVSQKIDADNGLYFRFLSSEDSADPVSTGHSEGVVTLDLAEADDAERERRRTQLHEPYRTLIGHFRHELAHYYWDLLIKNGPELENCRKEFGDDRLDYSEALKKHYDEGPPADWMENFVSSYATMHPWEDWAETWAHFTHIVATLDTALALSLVENHDNIDNAYTSENFDGLIRTFVQLAGAVNEVNRSMGVPDLYPFVLTPPALKKLRFIHSVIGETRQGRLKPNLGRAAQKTPS